MPSRIGLRLDIAARHLERVIYYEDYSVVDPGSTPLEKGAILTEEEFRNAEDEYGYDSFEAVSYTHLAVYKRQQRRSPLFPRPS